MKMQYFSLFGVSRWGHHYLTDKKANTGSSQPAHLLFKSREKISSIAQANDGELYLLGVNNRRGGDGIYRLASAQTDHGCDN